MKHHKGHVAAIEAELQKAETALDRYMHAFEAAKIDEDLFGDRVRELADHAKALRQRRAELRAAPDTATAPPPAPTELRVVQARLRDAMQCGNAADRKDLAQAFVHELAEARDRVRPTFRIQRDATAPDQDEAQVRAMTSPVGTTGLEL